MQTQCKCVSVAILAQVFCGHSQFLKLPFEASGRGEIVMWQGTQGPSVNYNVPGIDRASIDRLPNQGVAVFQGSPHQSVEFCESLRQALGRYPHQQCNFENIDVSNVQWEALNFSDLVDVLNEAGVATKRFKAFKCGLSDDSLLYLAEIWLQNVDANKMPAEIHLSHNSFGATGFEALLDVLETKRSQMRNKQPPIWLRVEKSGLDVSMLNKLAEQGRAYFCRNIADARSGPTTAVVAMPAPAGSVMPAASGQAVWNSQSSYSSSPMMTQGQQGRSWNQSPSNNQWFSCGISWNQQKQSGNGGSWNANGNNNNGSQSDNSTKWWEKDDGNNRGATKAAPIGAKRPRIVGPEKKVAPKASEDPPLLPGWEKQWSFEYGLPFFWNAETGASMWEAPLA